MSIFLRSDKAGAYPFNKAVKLYDHCYILYKLLFAPSLTLSSLTGQTLTHLACETTICLLFL